MTSEIEAVLNNQENYSRIDIPIELNRRKDGDGQSVTFSFVKDNTFGEIRLEVMAEICGCEDVVFSCPISGDGTVILNKELIQSLEIQFSELRSQIFKE